MTAWTIRMRRLLAALSAERLGYVPGENTVKDATGRSPHAVLDGFYDVCGGVSLPDVRNGYFIDGPARVDSARARGEPTELRPSGRQVLVFGSDGGGGRYAAALNDGEILYLPSSGAAHDNIFGEDDVVGVRVVAANASALLTRLEADIRAFIEGDSKHEYIS